jgi:hypothetical protein
MLLSHVWHNHFDSYHCTIRLKRHKYVLELCNYFTFSLDCELLEGKVLKFNGPKSQWPGAKFLEHHNSEFDEKQAEENVKRLKAAAEPKEFEKQDSDLTLGQHLDGLDYGKKDWISSWIKQQPNNDVEQLSDIPRESI